MAHFISRVLFIVGFFLGCFLAVFFQRENVQIPLSKQTKPFKEVNYENWFRNQNLKKLKLTFDQIRYNNVSYLLESEFLLKKIRILCVILLKSKTNVKAAKETWAKGCSNIIYVDLTTDKKTILAVKRNRNQSSWILLCKVLANVPEQYDWILVVNDDTFVILENLRYFVADLNPHKSYYLGHSVKFWSTVYNSGRAGYILSKQTIKMFKENSSDTCSNQFTYLNKEDFYLGKYLASLGIYPLDTSDIEGYSTFHLYNWHRAFNNGENSKLDVFPAKCCSRYSITFNAIEGDKMYTYHYLLYTLQIFREGNLGNRPPPFFDQDMVWKQFLKEQGVPLNVTSEEYYNHWVDLIDSPYSFAKNMKREVLSDDYKK